MRYNQVKELEGDKFRRLTGVKKTTFDKMLEILRRADESKNANSG